jgi:mRNA interferase HigB
MLFKILKLAQGTVTMTINKKKILNNRNFYHYSFEIQNFSCNFATEMRIVSHRRLVEFYSSEGHGDAQAALERWYDIAEKAEWKNLSDIKADFPTTDYVGNQHYVFDIRGNKYRLVVVVKFTIGHIFIRFVGTHSEYDKIDVSTI